MIVFGGIHFAILRRKNWFGTKDPNVCTALDVKANILCTNVGLAGTHPVLVADEEPEDELEAEVFEEVPVGEVAGNDGVALKTTDYRGWRLSYADPQPSTKAYIERIAKTERHMRAVAHHLMPAMARAPFAVRDARQRLAAKRKSDALATVPKQHR